MSYNKYFIIQIFIMASSILTIDAVNWQPFIGSEKREAPEPDVKFPGSDTANFPASPYTLPKGCGYFENYPLGIDFEGNNTPFEYNWPFLLRFGLTDSFELRLAGLGITHVSATGQKNRISGFSPLIFDCKVHLSGDIDHLWVPGTGIEMYVLTPIASQKLKIGTQFVVIALFEHRFPDNLSFEWNAGFGFSRYKKISNSDDLFGLISWALTKDISSKFSLFFQGLYNTKICNVFPKLFFLGIGAQVFITKRLAIYGNVNWSVFHNTNPCLLNIGFTVAF